jgi:hypothetical protein
MSTPGSTRFSTVAICSTEKRFFMQTSLQILAKHNIPAGSKYWGRLLFKCAIGLPHNPGSWKWNQCERVCESGDWGYILSWRAEQKRESLLHGGDSRCCLYRRNARSWDRVDDSKEVFIGLSGKGSCLVKRSSFGAHKSECDPGPHSYEIDYERAISVYSMLPASCHLFTTARLIRHQKDRYHAELEDFVSSIEIPGGTRIGCYVVPSGLYWVTTLVALVILAELAASMQMGAPGENTGTSSRYLQFASRLNPARVRLNLAITAIAWIIATPVLHLKLSRKTSSPLSHQPGLQLSLFERNRSFIAELPEGVR